MRIWMDYFANHSLRSCLNSLSYVHARSLDKLWDSMLILSNLQMAENSKDSASQFSLLAVIAMHLAIKTSQWTIDTLALVAHSTE